MIKSKNRNEENSRAAVYRTILYKNRYNIIMCSRALCIAIGKEEYCIPVSNND